MVSAAFFQKVRPEDATAPQKREVWPSPCRELARSCRSTLSLNTAASSAGLTAPRINMMLCGGHRVCHFAGGQRICVWPICSSRAGVELRREQPWRRLVRRFMDGNGRFRRPYSARLRSEPRFMSVRPAAWEVKTFRTATGQKQRKNRFFLFQSNQRRVGGAETTSEILPPMGEGTQPAISRLGYPPSWERAGSMPKIGFGLLRGL